MASSFRELQTIYESYPLANDTMSGNKYYPWETGKHTYRGYPGGPQENTPTIHVPENEEGPIETHNTDSEHADLCSRLRAQINEYLGEAEELKMEFAKEKLYSLLQTIQQSEKAKTY